MRLKVASLLIFLAGCGGMSPPPHSPSQSLSLPTGTADTCGAAAQATLIGQPATALERVLLLRPVRLVRPGENAEPAMPERLTFHIATPPGTPADTPRMLAERIIGVTCG